MRKPGIFITVLLLITFFIDCHKDTSVKTETQEFQSIDAKKAYLIARDNRNNPDFIIIDVRTPEEYSGGHIEKAINIDFNSENFQDEISKLNKKNEYLIYCRSGRRSADALEVFKKLIFKHVYNLSNGIISWTNNNLPLVK